MKNEAAAGAAPQFYLWSFPGCPVRVHLGLNVVQDLNERILALEAKASVDGILTGKTTSGKTLITGFQLSAHSGEPDAIAELARRCGEGAVGYFRLDRGETLQLNEKDLGLADCVFPKPHQVILLVQRTEVGPATATFFFRDGGKIDGNFSFLEFPFDARLLADAEKERAERAERKQSEILAAFESSSEPLRGVSQKRRKVVLAIALFFLAAAGALMWLGYPTSARTSIKAADSAAPPTPFHLHIERQDNQDLRLVWDGASAAVTNARSGILTIRDGDSVRQIPIEPTGLRGGNVLYSPVSDEVQFQLSIAGNAGEVSESVLAIVPRPQPSRILSSPKNPSFASDAVRDTRERAALRAFLPPKELPSVRKSAPGVNLAPPPDPVSSLASGAFGLPGLPSWLDPGVIQIPRPQPQSPSATGEPVLPSTTATPGTAPDLFAPAVAVSKVVAVYPPELRYSGRNMTVEVEVSINAAGKITAARSVSVAPQLFLNAAERAARLWRFRPATLNGHTVSSQMLIRFHFSSDVHPEP